MIGLCNNCDAVWIDGRTHCHVCGLFGHHIVPTKLEIERHCEAIRAGWSQYELGKRSQWAQSPPVEICEPARAKRGRRVYHSVERD